MALCLASTLLAMAVEGGRPAGMLAIPGIAILVLAWLKARLILAAYLGLAAAPFWRRGFEIALAAYGLLLAALYLIPAVYGLG